MLYYNWLKSHRIWLLLSTSKLKGTGTLHIKVDCNFSKTIVTLTYTWSRTRKNVTFLSRTNGQLWHLNNYKSLKRPVFSLHGCQKRTQRPPRSFLRGGKRNHAVDGTLFVAFSPPRSEILQYGLTASIKELERRRNWRFCFAKIQWRSG